jgi:hypothetical protein
MVIRISTFYVSVYAQVPEGITLGAPWQLNFLPPLTVTLFHVHPLQLAHSMATLVPVLNTLPPPTMFWIVKPLMGTPVPGPCVLERSPPS